MGAWISNIGHDDLIRIQKHEEGFDHNDEINILKIDPRKSIRWYHLALYDIRFRIFYTTILALVIGIVLPILLYYLLFHSSHDRSYGSCLIKTDYRFECLINGRRVTKEDECLESQCCYSTDDDESLPYKCYHSYPSSYQYKTVKIHKETNPNLPQTEFIHLKLEPKFETNETVLNLEVNFQWLDDGHFALSFNDLAPFNIGKNSGRNIKIDKSDEEMDRADKTHFRVSYSKESENFFISLQRKTTKETVFDTKLGPIVKSKNSLVFSTTLSSPYFFGLKGGQGEGRIAYNVINSPGKMELPFYLSIERSGLCHGLLLETSSPFTFQFIEAPGALFHLEGRNIQAVIHLFPGPTPADVYAQLHKYLKQSTITNTQSTEMEPMRLDILPPYWALGFHLCRRGFNVTEVHKELIELNENKVSIPYDSDCIDENLRTPFKVNQKSFSTNWKDWEKLLAYISNQKKKLLLTQKIGLDSKRNFVPLIQERDGTPLLGLASDGINHTKNIYYPDYIHSKSSEWSKTEMNRLEEDFGSHIDIIRGLVLVDNYPITVNSSLTCEKQKINTNISSSFYDDNLVCPDALHEDSVHHFDVHNIYGAESTRKLRSAFVFAADKTEERILTTSVSIWQSETSFTGLQVPFTWAGMRDSLSHVVRNFMLTTYTGTPICGSYISEVDEGITDESKEELCLRWFQLGLLMPFARNTYENGGIKGPFDINSAYRKYVAENIRNRYKYNPYYYTQLYKGIINPQPLIRPLVYDSNEELDDFGETINLVSQFMIGPSLMAAPILSQSPSRSVYFPRGTWYDLHGNKIADNKDKGIVLTIPSILAEIPIFIRNGYIIPTLAKPAENSAVETRAGNYSLIVTYPLEKSDVSVGSLYVDDGISINSISKNMFDYLQFSASKDQLKIERSQCKLHSEGISKNIAEIFIINFPNPETVSVTINPIPNNWNGNGSVSTKPFAIEEETPKLKLVLTPSIDWCEFSEFTIKWTTTTTLKMKKTQLHKKNLV